MPGERARVLRALNNEISAVIGRLQLKVLQELTAVTPVDTGFARGAWTPSVGSVSTAEDRAPRDREEAEAAAAFRSARSQRIAQDIARTYQVSRGPVFISNNTPYIGRLNDGYSAKAPARFVEAAIARAIRSSG